MKNAIFWIAAFFALLFGACANNPMLEKPQEPQVRLESAAIRAISAESIELDIKLELQNPTESELTIAGANVNLYYQDRIVSSNHIAKRLAIAPHTRSALGVSVAISTLDFDKIIKDYGTSEALGFKIEVAFIARGFFLKDSTTIEIPAVATTVAPPKDSTENNAESSGAESSQESTSQESKTIAP